VIGPDNVDRSAFNFSASRSTIIDTLNALGSALQEVGVTGALHQHTGSCIETTDETYAVMENVNTDVVKLCPDTGEMLAGGVDPVKAISDFLEVTAHVHIKDWNDGPTNDGYCPVGEGRVDVAGVIDVLETASHDFMIMAELNPGNPDVTALELATRSQQTFKELGYTF
jgi:inosose dehydratase